MYPSMHANSIKAKEYHNGSSMEMLVVVFHDVLHQRSPDVEENWGKDEIYLDLSAKLWELSTIVNVAVQAPTWPNIYITAFLLFLWLRLCLNMYSATQLQLMGRN